MQDSAEIQLSGSQHKQHPFSLVQIILCYAQQVSTARGQDDDDSDIYILLCRDWMCGRLEGFLRAEGSRYDLPFKSSLQVLQCSQDCLVLTLRQDCPGRHS